MVVVWSKSAKLALKKAYLYVGLESEKNAVLLRDEIIDMTIALAEHPEKHAPDKYKIENDGSWRAFEKYHYRISYKISVNEIRIVRVRHTSKSPVNY